MILFIITTIFIETNTDNWQFKFLIITLTTVAGLNAFSSTYTGTLYAVVGHFPPKYISSMTQGQAVSGVIAAIFQILSLWLSTGPIATGLMYFLIGDFIIIFAFISYIFLEKQEFFKYHMKEEVTIKNSDESVDDTPSSGDNNSVSFIKITIKIWPYALSMFLTNFLTHLVYPAVTSHIKSEAPSNTEWSAAGSNGMGAIFTGTMVSVAGNFPSEYISSLSQGQSACGIIAAIFQMLSLWLSTGPISTGLIYFLIGDFIIIFAFISYVFLEKQEFFKYHMKKEATIKNSDKSIDDTPSSSDNNSVPYMKIFIKILPYGLAMFLTYFITYLVYPYLNV
ncbi:hypothetical protein HCN44_003955 [Aphidius gifuensis]|uniref:Uncharacterized protein n=1 Tax=Aphidius gifuensis TaxID=684658 RepID=A0A834XVZ1_APHGI|nr:hypothetical protein HCN44_003955 [Aphidius gifuensis]